MTASSSPTRSPIDQLNNCGQSPWYDNLRREFVVSGGLQQLIERHGIRGVTSNPTIFEKAITAGEEYEAPLAELAQQRRSIEDCYWSLVLDDIRAASDVLAPIHANTNGDDGYVSIEVAPTVAHDTQATNEQVAWIHRLLDRPNVMVKVPATAAGIPAIETAIANGYSVNVTLIFSLVRYAEVIEAYQRGLERLVEAGGDPHRVASVASFFVSRVDTETDRRLPDCHALRGQAAVANARLAYEMFRQRFRGPRWEYLANRGARLQRPLWASTSTKNPAYSDTLYVDTLVGRDTVNTLAPASIDALADHGRAPTPNSIEEDLAGAHRVIDGLSAAGVDFDDVTTTLEREGVEAFEQSYVGLLGTLTKRVAELRG